MKPAEALEEIKKELETVFGKGLMGAIMLSARSKSKAPVLGLTKEQFDKFVDEICKDERVVGMLGAAGSRQKLIRWKKLAD